MSTSVVTVNMDDSLKRVKEIFDEAHFHHLLVVESNKLCGVVSDRDLLKSLAPNAGTVAETEKDAASLNKKVHQIMTRKLITVTGSSDIHEAITIFNRNDISCLPVVDDDFCAIGILSWRDILMLIEDTKNAQSGTQV